ncbi:hypothetical protein HK104_006366, partial [Borealophlyctis nickersoniae]
HRTNRGCLPIILIIFQCSLNNIPARTTYKSRRPRSGGSGSARVVSIRHKCPNKHRCDSRNCERILKSFTDAAGCAGRNQHSKLVDWDK